MDDIAVVGIGLRFPGNATSPEELWRVLAEGQSQWSEFPKGRLNIDGYYHPGGDRQGSISFRGAHFLQEDVAAFDAPFFSVSTDDAKAIDPQQRLLLEVSYEALENAGIRREDIDASDTAVYVGSFVKDYEQICLRDPDWQPQYAATGNGIAIMANRISYAFNFHGPSVTVDTGCSGSLVSVHLAAQSLRNGESSLAIAAGAGMILTPNTIMPMTALNFLSADGKCFTFDARANGYGRGEGIGVVVLKRLSDAVRDNDTIRAVIRGSRVNQDGRTAGITLPSKEAQVANIRSVYESSRLDFDQTAYVECHGTGTQAGDWREAKAISETFSTNRDTDNPIVVGSLKPNIGHLEGAAGVAGLIKGVLVLEHAKIPPNINFNIPNPDIDFAKWKLKVPTELMEWPIQGIRRVSVNCFGFGGTNAHVIMDEAPAHLASHGLDGNHMSIDASISKDGRTISSRSKECDAMPQLFCFSANEKSGVQRIINSHIPYIETIGASAAPGLFANYAYTLGCRRSVLEWKGTVVAGSTEELLCRMKTVNSDDFLRSSLKKKPRVCFMFCGQGSQWANMGQDLMSFEVFRESLEAASRYMLTELRSSFVLTHEISKPADESRISDPDIAQPATTALQIGLVELLSSLSINPTHVIGHSSGEIAAAFASGAISRETAWEVAYHRGLSAGAIPVKAPNLKGGMIAVGIPEQECQDYLDSINMSAQLACINSPRSVTVSGKADAIDFIAHDLRQKKIFHRVLPVQTAYHSEQMKLVENDYRRALGHLNTNSTPETTMFSSVTGQAVEGYDLNGQYWVQNMISPVRFQAAVNQMMALSEAERPNVFMELSPRTTLKSPTLDILEEMNITPAPTYLPVLDRNIDGLRFLLQTIGELWTRGYQINVKSLIARNSRPDVTSLKCLVDLPPYPWNHSRSYWHESHLGKANRFREHPRQDLIGAPTADSIPFEPRWRGFLRISENPWIQDHQVQKTMVYPAAGMVSMVLEGAKQMAKDQPPLAGYQIADMRVERAMLVPSTAHGLEIALNIKRDTDNLHDTKLIGSHEFAIYSKQLDGHWERNSTGILRFRYRDSDWNADLRQLHQKYSALQDSCAQAVVPRQLYELLDTVGMNYGPLFQNIVELRKGDNSCVATVRIPDTKSKMPAKFEYPHLIHPATLDSMFQTLFSIDSTPMVPTFIESLFVSSDLEESDSRNFCGFSTAQRAGLSDAKSNIFMRLDNTESYVDINGLHLASIADSMADNSGFLPNNRNLCTEVVWKEDPVFASPENFSEHLSLLAHKFPNLSVLQVGGGWPVSRAVLQQLASNGSRAPRLARYTVAEIHEGNGNVDIRKFQGTEMQPYVELAKVDGTEPLAQYHCILLFADAGMEPDSLKMHLIPGGWMFISNNPEVASNCLAKVNTDPFITTSSFGQMTPSQHPVSLATGNALDLVLLYPDRSRDNAQLFKEALSSYAPYGNLSLDVAVVSLSEVLTDASTVTGKVVVSILDAGGSSKKDSFVYNWKQSEFEAFHVMQKVARGVIWITHGAHMDPTNPRASPIVALARTLMSEDPQKIFVTLDLSEETSLMESYVPPMVLAVFVITFHEDSGPSPKEMEYAERKGKVYIPRLETVHGLNKLIENDGSGCGTTKAPFVGDHLAQSSHGLRLKVAKPGISEDALYFVEFELQELQANEVEIEFQRAVLTFRDLEVVHGRASAHTVGLDVVGLVSRLGGNVSASKFEPGANVVALIPNGSLQSVSRIDARLVVPARRGFVPSFFVSAYYGLVHVGRIRTGSKALIHAGASCFGLAAITIGSIAGAHIFATVLGDDADRQKEVLLGVGLRADHIFDANSSNLASTVRQATSGKGVDVVYNPTQESIGTSVECIKPGGVMVQFQDRSSTPKSLRRSPNNGTYVNLDLGELLKEDLDFVADLLERTVAFLECAPLECDATANVVSGFEIGQLEKAFVSLEKSPYIGHATVFGGVQATLGVPMLAADTTMPLRNTIDPSGTYVLAGGLGGLGRSISELLVHDGARNLVFLSRSGASSDQAREFVQSLVQRSINVRVQCVDICDLDALMEVVGNAVSAEMPPIRGVFQCAAVIKDAVFDNMSYSNWCAAFRPKTLGSWNLVESIDSTGSNPFFIFLASSAGVIGNRGQANYAAGNLFEDALARSLRLKGKHAASIDLGPILGAGMLSEDEDMLDRLRASGFYGIRHEDFLKVVKHAIIGETLPGVTMPPQVTLGVGTGGLIMQNQPADPYWSRTALYSYLNLVDMPPPDLTRGSSRLIKDIKTMLAESADVEAAAGIICTGLMHMLAKAMNMLFEEMDASKQPNSYGVDSLVAVGVRNWVFSNCRVQISVFEVLSDRTVGELAVMIAERSGFGGVLE